VKKLWHDGKETPGQPPVSSGLHLSDRPHTTLGYGFHSNIEILEHFQSKALRMIVDAPWYVPNRLSKGISKYQQWKKKSASTALNTVLASAHIQMTSKPDGATRQQAIAKTPAKWSAYQIASIVDVFVILVVKV
jgi:hypothetical protein